MGRFMLRVVVISVCLVGAPSCYAATPVDLGKQPVSFLKKFVTPPLRRALSQRGPSAANVDQIQEIKRYTDVRNVTHVRVQQQYLGFPVWGADAVLHLPARVARQQTLYVDVTNPAVGSSANGVMYQNLNSDLQASSAQVFTQTQADLAMSHVMGVARTTYGNRDIKPVVNKLMVYVDQANKAHWAFLASVYVSGTASANLPAKPVYIIDALSFRVYKTWNDMRGAEELVSGGGFGGNQKQIEKTQYDGLAGHLSAFLVSRDVLTRSCLMQNNDVELHDGRGARPVMSYPCAVPDSEHNQVFWDGGMDEINGGYSPANDALYAGSIVQQMYQQWLHVPMLKARDGKPMVLKMFVHVGSQWENAEWDPEKEEVRLGDGANMFYPLTSLDIIAHEVSHGFTSQHSNLIYADQSGSIDESFSDIAAQAAEFFSTKQNSWQIGAGVMKERNAALRYMDQPSKDCRGRKAGDACSIDTAAEYAFLEQTSREYTKDAGEDERQSYIVHLGSGVFNRAYYLLATTPGWDAQKAFVVMAGANANYWTQTSNFEQAACGVMRAALDENYDRTAVAAAFAKVGIDTRQC